jgi:hypothetical protein
MTRPQQCVASHTMKILPYFLNSAHSQYNQQVLMGFSITSKFLFINCIY